MIWMPEKEIVRSYRQADNKWEQITILAELNNCGRDKIIRILQRYHEWVPECEEECKC